MIVDTHMHTCFSTDSKMTITQAIEKSGMLGIGITITEHMDLEYPIPNAFTFNINDYLNEYEKYRSDNVLLGIEIGMRPECLADNAKIIKGHQLDYVIGSIHIVDKVDIYQPDFYHLRTKQEVYQQYFRAMIECLNNYDFIDSLGHIDYIARYAKYTDPEIYYHEFSDYIDQVLTIVAQKNKALEINTRRLGNSSIVQALLPIYQRFYELGGRLVTIGSDAHKPEDIGRDIATAVDIADLCQLKVVHFRHRKPQYLK